MILEKFFVLRRDARGRGEVYVDGKKLQGVTRISYESRHDGAVLVLEVSGRFVDFETGEQIVAVTEAA